MTWSPSIESGLSGDTYLSEQMEAFVDDLADAHAPGVYILKLSQPESFETAVRRYQDHFDPSPPEWLMGGWSADNLLYVGASVNVYERITEHLESPNKSAAITRVFPIHSVFGIRFMDTAEEAFDREGTVALELKNKFRGAYVHQR